MRSLLRLIAVLAALQAYAAIPAFAFHLDPPLSPEPPLVICNDQRYALCAEATCFVFDGVAYCKCEIENGNSISLQLSYSTPTGQQNVCDANRQGRANGYMISTFSLPTNVIKGGSAAVYTCPGSADAGSGVVAPVAYGQCDGGFCFKSTKGQRIPGYRPPETRRDHLLLSDFHRCDSRQLGYLRLSDLRPVPSDGVDWQPL